eukprot:TRINITY_DN8492_c0_g1_i1.p1 TRINITY_DN8492_c0_g1~~TRINITY_DN8492_c0_g1_i1.p1  ORF type:complete len:468 (-),score=88.54 TRINITY_DN8492_c0_g1_i1:8-1411(-)
MLFSNQEFYISPVIPDSLLTPLKNTLCTNGATLTADLQKNVVIVSDPDNPYDDISDLDNTNLVVSPQCIFDSVRKNVPLALKGFCLGGLLLCIDKNIPEDLGLELQNLSKILGNRITKKMDKDCDFLVSESVGSIDYKVAITYNKQVISSEWLFDCFHKKDKLPIDSYILPPFAGCVISVTGFSSSSRNRFQNLVHHYGGEYTPNLTKRCTHLIFKTPGGIKYHYGTEWGIFCVNLDWLFDSINLGVCIEETSYTSKLLNKKPAVPLNVSSADLNRLSPALRKKYLGQINKKHDPTGSGMYMVKIPYMPGNLRSPMNRVLLGGLPNHMATPRSSSMFPYRRISKTVPPVNIDQPNTLPFNRRFGAVRNSFCTRPPFQNRIREIGPNPDLAMESFIRKCESKKLVSKTRLVEDIKALIDMCDSAIENYKNFAKDNDISPILELQPGKRDRSSSFPLDEEINPSKKRKL